MFGVDDASPPCTHALHARTLQRLKEAAASVPNLPMVRAWRRKLEALALQASTDEVAKGFNKDAKRWQTLEKLLTAELTPMETLLAELAKLRRRSRLKS
jgi:hypothetical protein